MSEFDPPIEGSSQRGSPIDKDKVSPLISSSIPDSLSNSGSTSDTASDLTSDLISDPVSGQNSNSVSRRRSIVDPSRDKSVSPANSRVGDTDVDSAIDTKNMSYSMHIDAEQMRLMTTIRQRSLSKLPTQSESTQSDTPNGVKMDGAQSGTQQSSVGATQSGASDKETRSRSSSFKKELVRTIDRDVKKPRSMSFKYSSDEHSSSPDTKSSGLKSKLTDGPHAQGGSIEVSTRTPVASANKNGSATDIPDIDDINEMEDGHSIESRGSSIDACIEGLDIVSVEHSVERGTGYSQENSPTRSVGHNVEHSAENSDDDKQSTEDTSSFDVDEMANACTINEQIAYVTTDTTQSLKTIFTGVSKHSGSSVGQGAGPKMKDRSHHRGSIGKDEKNVYIDAFDQDLSDDVTDELLSTSDSLIIKAKQRAERDNEQHVRDDYAKGRDEQKISTLGVKPIARIAPVAPVQGSATSLTSSIGVGLITGLFSGSNISSQPVGNSDRLSDRSSSTGEIAIEELSVDAISDDPTTLDIHELASHGSNHSHQTAINPRTDYGSPDTRPLMPGEFSPPTALIPGIGSSSVVHRTDRSDRTASNGEHLSALHSVAPKRSSGLIEKIDSVGRTGYGGRGGTTHSVVDLSESCIGVDRNASEKLKKLNIETRRVSKWVEDGSVAKCFNCNTEFTMVLRRHHCRLCGRVFCYYCSNYFTKLPLDILNKIPDKPQSFTDMIWGDDLNGNVRVCKTCFSHASKLIRIRKLIKVFEMCQFNIRDLVFLSRFSPDWEDASKFLLSKFREIQYKLSIEELTPAEKQLLWINRNFLTGHSRWMVQLVKATDLADEKAVFILEQLMYKQKKNRCWDIMCTRFCSEVVGITDMLDLIRYNNNSPVISNFIIKCLNDMKLDVLINYLPFMVFNIGNNEFILDILLGKSISKTSDENFKFVAHLYWCVKVYCTNPDARKSYIVQILTTIRNKTSQEFRHRFKEMISMERLDIKWLHLLNEKKRIVLPLCTDKTFVGVDDKNVKIMSSYSQPAIINFIDAEGVEKPIMFKNDDVRKDYIVLSIINIIHDILKREETDLDIDMVRYEVIPTSKQTGYIEIVENASTVFNIVEDSGLTIQNYILNHNKDQVISRFREKFIKSTALYCVVSYLLGIGDRHLDNIMISKDGLLFHIDFGFILGQDPKYSNNRLIRVTPEIINVIGGYGTEDYDYFKKTCVKIYNRLRLHVNLFSNLLSIIPSIDPSITMDVLKRELTERFEIGENCLEAATHMDTKVDSKNNFEYMVIDLLHRSAKSRFVKGIAYVSESIFSAFKGK
ncbi:phosphoinositide 3-kinase [Yasminevirus sp. GU-2018]|uniref:Phosphoinositide 3-kinase n=1 Tax=Yasminevirus sp. GU-2018 TaxID=2420051 RepID=A0A5K0U9J2_9VIRU|nr:phosphoinositide 3-kinase [Yasminevirus sp. GU-2018]